MEHENQFASAAINNDNTAEDATIATDKKKKKGGLGFFKAAMLMLRSSSSNKKKSEKQLPPSAAANPDAATPLSPHKWQRIVGSMRPLTLQEEDGSPVRRHEQQQFLHYHHQRLRSSPSMDSFEDAMIPPYSPSCRSMSSSGTVSQYASANNLYAMDEHNGEGEDNDGAFDNKPADDMIDEKAEQFIAHFYAQMRSQHFD